MDEKVKAIKCAWSDEAESALAISMMEDCQVLKRQVQVGVSELWRFKKGLDIDLWMIVRREFNELVICCVEGVGLMSLVKLIEDSAISSGCTSIRFHTKKKGIVRMMDSVGFGLKEFVYHKEVG